MGKLTAIQLLRRDAGLCIICGNAIKEKKRRDQIKCNACLEAEYDSTREKNRRNAENREARTAAIREAEAQKAERERKMRLEIIPPTAVCEHCVWPKYVDHGLYVCPFPQCALSYREKCVAMRCAKEERKKREATKP